jgi:hypothetical protein
VRNKVEEVAVKRYDFTTDTSGTNIDVQILILLKLIGRILVISTAQEIKPVLIVMDYAWGNKPMKLLMSY